jgi:hypothetical protein
MDRLMSIAGTGLLVAAAIGLNMIRYPVVSDGAGADAAASPAVPASDATKVATAEPAKQPLPLPAPRPAWTSDFPAITGTEETGQPSYPKGEAMMANTAGSMSGDPFAGAPAFASAGTGQFGAPAADDQSAARASAGVTWPADTGPPLPPPTSAAAAHNENSGALVPIVQRPRLSFGRELGSTAIERLPPVDSSSGAAVDLAQSLDGSALPVYPQAGGL